MNVRHTMGVLHSFSIKNIFTIKWTWSSPCCLWDVTDTSQENVLCFSLYSTNGDMWYIARLLPFVQFKKYVLCRLQPTTLLKVRLLYGRFSRFFKLYKWYQIAQSITYVLVIARFQVRVILIFSFFGGNEEITHEANVQ